MSDLRTCPWCGVIPDTDDGESGGTVECCNRQCPVQPSIFRDHEPSHNGLSLATDEWNTRALDAQAEKLAGLLREALRDLHYLNNIDGEDRDLPDRITEALAAYDAERKSIPQVDRAVDKS